MLIVQDSVRSLNSRAAFDAVVRRVGSDLIHFPVQATASVASSRIILCSLLGIDVSRFRYRLACPVGSISMVEFTTNGPMLKTLADRSHLSEDLRSLRGT
jgi:broad specificity phosphatase PhoE